MTYIGDDPDVKVLIEDDCDKTRLVRLVFLHYDHDILRSDNPAKLEVGFSCVDCDVYWGAKLVTLKNPTSSKFIDDFFKKLVIEGKNAQNIRALVSQYPDFVKKLDRLKCMI